MTGDSGRVGGYWRLEMRLGAGVKVWECLWADVADHWILQLFFPIQKRPEQAASARRTSRRAARVALQGPASKPEKDGTRPTAGQAAMTRRTLRRDERVTVRRPVREQP